MEFWSWLKKQNQDVKKAVAGLVVFVLAVPLLVLIGWNFQQRMSNLKSEELMQGLNLPSSNNSQPGLSEQTLQGFTETLQALQQGATTSQATTSPSDKQTATSTGL